MRFFEPADKYLTLSTDLGFTKDENLGRFLETALAKISDKILYKDSIFVTENPNHIALAKNFGVNAFQYTPLGGSRSDGTIDKLVDLIPKIRSLLNES